jgi:uncharacterized iron-regulated membrane protein
MLARLDHRPMLTAFLALSTIILFLVVVTLTMLLITLPQATSLTSGTIGDNPAAASHKRMEAGGKNHANNDYYRHHPVAVKPAQMGDGGGSFERHAALSDRATHAK